MARRGQEPVPEGHPLVRRGRLTVREEAEDRWVAELRAGDERRTHVGSRWDVLVWGLVQLPQEAVVLGPGGGERSFYDWEKAVRAEGGPVRPAGENGPAGMGGRPAVLAKGGCPGGSIDGLPEPR